MKKEVSPKDFYLRNNEGHFPFKHPHVHTYSMTFFQQTNDGCVKDIPDGNTPLALAFPCQPNLPPYSRPDHIDDRNLRLKGIPHRTNCKKFKEICSNIHTGQEKSITASRSKIS